MEKSVTKVKGKMKKFLQAYDKAMGNVSQACQMIGISRKTFYLWKNTNEEFAKLLSDVDEKNVDFAETMLLKNIRDGKETSLIFFLKTKGKNRGYVESTEVTANVTGSFNLRRLTDEELDELKELNKEN